MVKEDKMVSKPRMALGISIFILISICLIVGNVYAQGAKEFYEKAKAYLNKGMYDEAIAEVTKAI
jgi:outer membrane protein assembly factor BamD (BamD/ComL family)